MKVRSAFFATASLVLLLVGSYSHYTFGQAASVSATNSGNSVTSQTDADYYQSAYKLYGTALRAALHNIIKGHTALSYDGLYTAFPTTDVRGNNKVWDIYSDIPGGTPKYEFTHGSKKCGSYSGEGDCYNREHSWCDSWLGQTNPARSDLYHMYPTDGYVNNRRNNYNFGTVSTPTWTSSNGSKLGPNTYPGYTGTVFEPIDEYKGDLARSAMYMSCRYYTEDASWSTSSGTNKSDLLQWYANLFYDWHMKDTVSKKEQDRASAIYTFQKNHNPFIDHPEFAAEIWKTDMAPSIVSIKLNSPTSLVVDFSRVLDSTAAVTLQNYVTDNSLGYPVNVQWGVNNDYSKVMLSYPGFSAKGSYSIQIKNIKSINNIAMKDTAVAFIPGGATDVKTELKKVRTFSLEQNYPNPFNPTTEIEFDIYQAGVVSLRVFDVLGNQVAELVNGVVAQGNHKVTFDASHLSSGVYYYQLKSENYLQSKKMMLMK